MNEEEEKEVRGRSTLVRCVELGEEMIDVIKGILPDDFWVHNRAARREMFLAFRALLDAAIARSEGEPESDETKPKSGRIEVE
jgi:hypothetical protein